MDETSGLRIGGSVRPGGDGVMKVSSPQTASASRKFWFGRCSHAKLIVAATGCVMIMFRRSLGCLSKRGVRKHARGRWLGEHEHSKMAITALVSLVLHRRV